MPLSFWKSPQSCGACRFSRTERQESGGDITACYFNPPTLISELREVNGKSIQVVVGKFPGVSPTFAGCGQFKRK